MTKAKALKIAKKYFDLYVKEKHATTISYSYLTPAPCLCYNIPDKELRMAWNSYWDAINNKNWATMISYFKHNSRSEEATLLRLLVLHQFIDEHYE